MSNDVTNSAWRSLRGRSLVGSGACLISALVVAGFASPSPSESAAADFPTAPPMTGVTHWINSQPIELAKLRGKVVVLHFWTFGCINCQRNLPYYNKWREEFDPEHVAIIGVHTPELQQEADLRNVEAAVKRLGIKYPVAVDNAEETWKAYRNRYWPSIYLIDKRGRVRSRWDGELESQGRGGDKLLRARIKALVDEDATPRKS